MGGRHSRTIRWTQPYLRQAPKLHVWIEAGLVSVQKASATIFPDNSVHCTTRF